MASSIDECTIWYPAFLVSPASISSNPYAVIILNQPLPLRPTIYQQLFSKASHIIAADGGANRLYELFNIASPLISSSELNPSLIIGDLDSLLPTVRVHFERQKIPIIHDVDQYSTDFGKAFQWIQERAQSRSEGKKKSLDVVVLGGLGGRIDQGLSVLHHIYMFQTSPSYAEGKMFLLSGESITFLLKAGRHRIKVKEKVWETDGVKWGLGKHVGIIPIREASVITTRGLEWDVKDWKTEFGGQMSTSNWVKDEWVEVETQKDVLFTIDLVIEGG